MGTNRFNKLVYIVDDDVFFNNLFEYVIQNQTNLKTTAFKNPQDCLEKMSNGEVPEIIFLDYNFSRYDEADVNGIEMLKKIKVLCPNVNVVLVSSNSSQELLISSSKNGALGYFVKSNNSMNGILNFLRNYYFKKNYSI